MKILLMGEYSGLHSTLADGLRRLGQDVCVLSDGNEWKNYPRDIDLMRPTGGPWGGVRYVARLLRCLPRLRGYDVVQLVNPGFLRLRPEKCLYVYRYLKRHNGKVFLGAFGMDYYWVNVCRMTDTFRYSDFNFGGKLRDDAIAMREVEDWIGTKKGNLNQAIASDCDGIIAGLYEYYACYRPYFPEKTVFIPFPINVDKIKFTAPPVGDKVKFFIGVQKERGVYKGTDIMLRALERVHRKYPERCEIVKAESVPYTQYCTMMDNSNVLLDKLYSYTPAMNGLLAMAKGLVLVGGGEEENYEVLGEKEMRPIVNVLPDEEDVYRKLEQLVLRPEMIEKMSRDSRRYIEKYHDYRKVAGRYVEFWNNCK